MTYDVINETLGRGGNIIIPPFAMERAQKFSITCEKAWKTGHQALHYRVSGFTDAISATQIFERHPECFDTETLQLSHHGRDPF